jgi:hypothetical protein
VCVISFPNVPAINQYDLNPGLELVNPGIIDELPDPDLYHLRPTLHHIGLGGRHTGQAWQAGHLAGLLGALIVPSTEIFATYDANALDCLIESTDEGWNNSIPSTNPRPQPDYFVEFRREAFTETQLQKLQPFVGELTDNSFMATYYMYFPLHP